MSIASEYVEKVNQLSAEERWEDVVPVWHKNPGLEFVVTRELIDEHRWYNILRNVFKCEDGSYFEVTWDDPATEMQEGQDYNSRACLVEPQEVTVTQYVKVKS